MSDIDFLPVSYRQMTVHRKANVWRVLAGGLFVAMIGFSAVYQHLLRGNALLDLARTGPHYDRAQALVAGHAELKRQLQSANHEADLFTYLRHPWPTTQVLAAALSPLPDCITLHQIRLFQGEAVPSVATASALKTPPQKKSSEAESAAKRDLDKLRQDNDGRPRVVTLSGITTDSAALQQYVLALGQGEFFVKTELVSLEADMGDRAGSMHFTARLIVRPGYSQPGAPSPHRVAKPTTDAAQKIASRPDALQTSVAGADTPKH